MCCKCDRPGHYSGQCPLLDICRTTTQSLQFGYYFAQTTQVQRDLINTNCILIYSCSKLISVINPSLRSDIKDCDPDMAICVFINCGHLDYKKYDTVDLLPLKVLYNKDSIANILALLYVTIQFRVTMYTNNEPAMFFQNVPGVYVWSCMGCFVKFNLFKFRKTKHTRIISVKLSRVECICNYKQMDLRIYSDSNQALPYHELVRFLYVYIILFTYIFKYFQYERICELRS